MEEKILNFEDVHLLSIKADNLLLSSDDRGLREFIEQILSVNYIFENLSDEAQFCFTVGNCLQEIYKYRELDWFSDNLSQSIIFYRKALYALQRIKHLTDIDLVIKGSIETNLGNSLSSQGRVFCCIPFWDSAYSCTNNPVSLISKANNELFIAGNLYDHGHAEYHQYIAYKFVLLGIDTIEELYPEQKAAYAEGSNFINFKIWFESNYELESFKYFDDFEEVFETKKQEEYLEWCGNNRLFINDLNDVCTSEVVYQDIMTLPSISAEINISLTLDEELVYHGNFDEIKNDYCYARYLTFIAQNMSNEEEHIFNKTYPHANDISHSITNIKANHYKSAFRTLYSLFDKIAYFINRFFDLNNIAKDHRISFDSLFRQLNNNKGWKPNDKLRESNNYFIHALFYILKDIKDVKGVTPTSHWLDPNTKKISEIRNSIEHRSLKIVDDFGDKLNQLDKVSKVSELENIRSEVIDLENNIEVLSAEITVIGKIENNALKELLQSKMLNLKDDLLVKKSKVYEKNKLSSHSLTITESDFKEKLITLMKLVRNSIMYMSLAIHLEERNKLKDDRPVISRETPLK
ncbi:LA2681 family HEPN domain-containing protein [Psychrobacter sp. DM4]|uniref:LA2681 family HEPN domain-containing protein n=1 Tax=Psychrobacter sp. DM4 TaxID=3440637 RepID=UPI003F4F7FCB